MSDHPKFGFWPFVIPFLAFIALSMFEPGFGNRPDAADSEEIADDDANENAPQILPPHDFEVRRFLLIYGVKILVTTALLVFFFRYYLQPFPLSISALAVPVGVVGVLLWVGICQLNLESYLWVALGFDGASGRSEFNPFVLLSDPYHRAGFFALRFFGLVIIVPICEELFLRGFLMRVIDDPQWWTARLSEMGVKAILVAPLYGALTHPEILAAVVWFSMVTWLMKRTGKFWDCVVAHAVTNLLLGVYVIAYGQWHLW